MSTIHICESTACLACALRAQASNDTHPVIAPSRAIPCDIERVETAPPLVRAAVALIRLNYTENMPLTTLARTLMCSPWSLSRQFRSSTGLTVTQYRTQVRLALALPRLREGEPSLAGLAVDLGFSHHSHFTTACVRVLGARPGSIRSSVAVSTRRAGCDRISRSRRGRGLQLDGLRD